MDRVSEYRQIICQFLKDFSKDDPDARLIFDKERDRYLVLHSGWRNDYRFYGCAIHLDLIDGKVWIQQNSTEVMVDQDLEKLGVSPKDIILGFRSPEVRERLAALR